MALFNGSNSSAPARGAREDRPSAQLWVNVGVVLPVEQEDGSTKDTFLALPVGIPVDTTEPMPIRGNNKAWNQQVAVKNALLKFAQDVGSKLQPGESELLENLQVQVYRRNVQQEEPAADSNPLLAALAAKGFGTKAA